MHRLIPAALALALIAAEPQPRHEPFVPVGVWYGGGAVRPPMLAEDPAPEREAWRRDLQTIRSLGFNSIRNWIDWAGAEPERGRHRFDALDQLLTLADEAGLKVILQIYSESAPEWLWRRHGDASVITAQGGPIGAQGAPAFCLDHPGVRADVAAFISAVSERAARHRSFYAIDVWREPHIVSPASLVTPVELCFCPHTQRRFREWLRVKYGTLDALNGAWDRTFTSWEQAEAPRGGTIRFHTDFIDWKTFVAFKLQEDLKFKSDASSPRAARLVSSHSDAPAVMLNPLSGVGRPDDWWMVRSVDHYGTSIDEPADAATQRSPVHLMSALDGIRSAARDRGWWVGELQAGQVATGSQVTGTDLRLRGWAALSRGARAISYSGWFPGVLVEPDGTIAERAQGAGELAGIISRNPALFAPLRPRPSKVAVLYNRLSYVAGGNTETPGAVRDSMHGFYRAMFERNIQTDFIHPDEILAGRAGEYQAIFLGYPLMLSQAVARALELYVSAGGTVISEARPGWQDEGGHASARIPGLGLDVMFGAREKAVRSPERIEMIGERDLDGPLAPLASRSLAGSGFAEHLEITGAATRVLARFPGENGAPGDPAIVMSAYGSGRAILIGSFPAGAFEQDPQKARSGGELLAALAALAGVTTDVRIDGGAGFVEARFLESASTLMLIGINHADTPQKVTLNFQADMPEAIWQNMESGASVSFVAGADGPTYTHAFQPRDVLVLMIGKDLR